MKLTSSTLVPVALAATGVIVFSAAPTSAATAAAPTERAPKSCGKIKILDTAVITTEEGTDPVTWRSGGYRYQISDNFAIDVASSYKQRCKIAKQTLKSFYTTTHTYDDWYAAKASKKKMTWVDETRGWSIRVMRNF